MQREPRKWRRLSLSLSLLPALWLEDLDQSEAGETASSSPDPAGPTGFILTCLGKGEEKCFESNETIQSRKQVSNAQIKLFKLPKVANSKYFDPKALFCKRDAECSTEENIHQKSKTISWHWYLHDSYVLQPPHFPWDQRILGAGVGSMCLWIKLLKWIASSSWFMFIQ